ncbi:CHAT domain-containing protein [Nocardia sp. NPDC059240]|uniref:CHAT domain-containing protein n=1 Tax=Nocardia sp. NPDC059240 TaxID=3346786 RepID=UPI0036CFB9C4
MEAAPDRADTPREALQAVVASRLRLMGKPGNTIPAVLDPHAVEEARQLAAVLHDGDGDLRSRLLLGWVHWYRFLALPRGQDQPDLELAIEMFLPVFVSDGVIAQEFPARLTPALADVAEREARDRLDREFGSRDTAAVTTTVELWRRIVAATPHSHPEQSDRLSTLGTALTRLFVLQGLLPVLEEAIEVARRAVAVTSADHPKWSKYRAKLAVDLETRYQRTGQIADLDEATELARQALAGLPTAHRYLPAGLSNLAHLLRQRFERKGVATDLDEALFLYQRALDSITADDPRRAEKLSDLGNALRVRFDATDALADLDRAVDIARQAVVISRASKGYLLANLATALRTRFDRTGFVADLDEAVEMARRAVTVTHPDDLKHASRQSTLASSLLTRFERTGVAADIDEAVRVGQAAVARTPHDHPNRPMYLSNLGIALRTRFERTGALTDLDQAVDVSRQAATATPTDDRNHAGVLSNLAIALSTRFDRSGLSTDLDEAIEIVRRALEATPTGHPDRAAQLSSLGGYLRTRFSQTAQVADLNEAVRAGRQAVACVPSDHPDRAIYLSNLGISLQVRFRKTDVGNDLDEAIVAIRQAVDAVPGDHPYHAIMVSNLGTALSARHAATHARVDLDEAISYFRAAVQLRTAKPSTRILTAQLAAEVAAVSRPDVVAELMETAVRLLPDVAPRQLQRSDQQYALGEYRGLASDAAALALSAPSTPASQRAGLALRLLEVGRGVLLSQALQVRNDLTELTDRHPTLAREFTRLRNLLDEPDIPVTLVEAGNPGRDRNQLVDDFEQLLTTIRAMDGFESFAAPPAYEQLLAQAAFGPIVAFNISRHRCDALLLTTSGIDCLPLPLLTLASATDKVKAFTAALRAASYGTTKDDRQRAQQELQRVLEWLWDSAAGPVLDFLGCEPKSGPRDVGQRVWWIPGGLLGLLPIHAAGYHTGGSESRTVMDRVVSSYAPTIAALAHARQHPPKTDTSTANRALIVAMPTTPDVPGRLRHVLDEANLISTRLPGSITLTEPDDCSTTVPADMPTRTNVLNLLKICSIAHFACHGTSDPSDPSRSHLLLHDHAESPLTVDTLTPVHLAHARLAYLSACNSARAANTRLIDEAIHLTSAFQLAGYPHVIGTLWAINDEFAVQIAKSFYTALTATADNSPNVDIAAHALHHAVRTVREMAPNIPSLWAAHIHVGV